MALIDTTSNDDSYLFYVAKIRSLRGDCVLKMATFDDLFKILYYLLAFDDEVRVTTSNELGKRIFKALKSSKYLISV